MSDKLLGSFSIESKSKGPKGPERRAVTGGSLARGVKPPPPRYSTVITLKVETLEPEKVMDALRLFLADKGLTETGR